MSHSAVLVIGPTAPKEQADESEKRAEKARKLAAKSTSTNHPEEAATFARKAAELRSEVGQPNPLKDTSWLDEALAPFNEELDVEPYKERVALPDGWQRTMANSERFRQLMDSGVERRAAWAQVWGEKNEDAYVPWQFSGAIRDGIDPSNLAAIAARSNQDGDEEKHEVDGEGLFYWTTYNPRSRWDWWTLGGRWSGFFLLRPDGEGMRGRDGLMGSHLSENGVDLVRKGDVDWEAMLAAAAQRAEKTWAEAMESGRDAGHLEFMYGIEPSDTRETFVKRRTTLTTFAVLKDGEWYERGRMGWFGCASNEKDASEWSTEWMNLVLGLPNDTVLALVDVHI